MLDKEDIYNKIMGDMNEVKPEYLVSVRDALREELDAMNTYTLLRDNAPNQQVREIMDEILTDEVNHAGRLADVVKRIVSPTEWAAFEAGLQQEEPKK